MIAAMLTGLHFLTTYACNFECDHCFLYCGPRARGTFTIEQLRAILDDAARLGSIETVFFEGGEPFLYFPLVLAGIDLARERGFKSGIVTNGYWATSPADAELWLAPLCQRGVATINVSDDSLHYGDNAGSRVAAVKAAAARLGMEVKVMRTEKPSVTCDADGKPAVVGGVMFRGRAADKLAADLPVRPWESLATCPHEKLAEPHRVHVDAFGHVHLCQGLTMGNCCGVPLDQLVKRYDPQNHPIVAPLLRGGPAELAKTYDLPHERGYVDECHFCHRLRSALIGRFGEHLAPRQVYGFDGEPDAGSGSSTGGVVPKG